MLLNVLYPPLQCAIPMDYTHHSPSLHTQGYSCVVTVLLVSLSLLLTCKMFRNVLLGLMFLVYGIFFFVNKVVVEFFCDDFVFVFRCICIFLIHVIILIYFFYVHVFVNTQICWFLIHPHQLTETHYPLQNPKFPSWVFLT